MAYEMLPLTKELAKLAASSLCDVFDEDGDALVIDRVHGQRVYANDNYWRPMEGLTISEQTVKEIKRSRAIDEM